MLMNLILKGLLDEVQVAKVIVACKKDIAEFIYTQMKEQLYYEALKEADFNNDYAYLCEVFYRYKNYIPCTS